MIACPFCQNKQATVGVLWTHIQEDHLEEMGQVVMRIFSTLGEMRYAEEEKPGP